MAADVSAAAGLRRRKKTAAERRAQHLRAEGQLVSRLLAGFAEVRAHRGTRLSRVAEALRVTLTGLDADRNQDQDRSQDPAQDRDQDRTEASTVTMTTKVTESKTVSRPQTEATIEPEPIVHVRAQGDHGRSAPSYGPCAESAGTVSSASDAMAAHAYSAASVLESAAGDVTARTDLQSDQAEEDIEGLPERYKRMDPLYGAKVCRRVGGMTWTGRVHDIEIGKISREKF